MAYRGGDRAVGCGERLERAHEIGQGHATTRVFSVSRLIKPDHAKAAGEQGRDETAHLHAASTPTVSKQNGGSPCWPGLPDGQRMLPRDDCLPERSNRMRFATGVARGQRKQVLGMTAGQVR